MPFPSWGSAWKRPAIWRPSVTRNIGVILYQPAPLFILDGRYGVSEKLDLGIKLAGPAARFDGKYWFYHSGKLDAAVSLGYTRHSSIGSSALESTYKLFEFLKLVEYNRKDVDAAILLSGDSNAVVSPYGAVRYIAAFVDLETNLEEVPTENELPGNTKSTMHHMGGTAGMRVKVGPVHFLAEVTVMKIYFDPTILGKKTDLGGFLIEPLLGFATSF